MFDIQVRRMREPDPAALESIRAYYGRVTGGAYPMNRLIAVVMLASMAALGAQVADGDVPRWVSIGAFALTASAVILAGSQTVPRAERLGRGGHEPREELRLARLMLRDHVFCLAVIVCVLVLQLGFAR